MTGFPLLALCARPRALLAAPNRRADQAQGDIASEVRHAILDHALPSAGSAPTGRTRLIGLRRCLASTVVRGS